MNIRIIKDFSGNISYKTEDGKFHRDDGPALILISGQKSWYQNGKLHREDGPAIQYPEGDERFYLNHICVSKEEWNKQILIRKLEILTNNSKI